MTKSLTPEELTRARAQALQSHNRAQKAAASDQKSANSEGLIPHLVAWKNAAFETTKKYLGWTGYIAKPVTWAAPKIGHGLVWHWKTIAYKTDEDGQKHFSPKRLAFGLATDALLITLSPLMAMGAYYYGTLHTYKDIFVPNAGVFVNQQFVQPSQSGHIVAPRDEIFTVLGQRAGENGKIESIRFDVDSNAYFFYKPNAMRPDLLSAQLVPISPYGAMCDVQATGLYTRLPRFFRTNAVKWLDMRPEIVSVKSCEQLKSVPTEYQQGNAPNPPAHSVPLPAPTTPTVN